MEPIGAYYRKGSMTSISISPPRPYSLGWVKSDFAQWGMSGIEHYEIEIGKELYSEGPDGERVRMNGIPLPVRLYDATRVDTREGTDTRRLALEVFGKNAPIGWSTGDIRQAWLGAASDDRAFFDHSGGDGWGYNPTISRRNAIYLTGDTMHTAGIDLLEMLVLKVGKYDDMLATIRAFPLLAFDALTSTRGMGGRQVDPFWFLGGNPCKIIMFGKYETNWINADYVKVLDPHEPIPSSPWPARL